jgi:hypothetical protein
MDQLTAVINDLYAKLQAKEKDMQARLNLNPETRNAKHEARNTKHERPPPHLQGYLAHKKQPPSLGPP